MKKIYEEMKFHFNKIKCQQCGSYLEEMQDVDGGTWFRCPDTDELAEEGHSLFYLDDEGDLI